jgi:tRNA 2-selenouridine synthase
MKAAPRVEVRVPASARAKHTLETYPDMVAHSDRIEDALDRLIPLHGKAKIAEWRALAEEKNFRAFAEALIVEHYDPAYTRARKRQAEGPAAVIEAERLDGAGLDFMADQLTKAAHGLAPY